MNTSAENRSWCVTILECHQLSDRHNFCDGVRNTSVCSVRALVRKDWTARRHLFNTSLISCVARLIRSWKQSRKVSNFQSRRLELPRRVMRSIGWCCKIDKTLSSWCSSRWSERFRTMFLLRVIILTIRIDRDQVLELILRHRVEIIEIWKKTFCNRTPVWLRRVRSRRVGFACPLHRVLLDPYSSARRLVLTGNQRITVNYNGSEHPVYLLFMFVESENVTVIWKSGSVLCFFIARSEAITDRRNSTRMNRRENVSENYTMIETYEMILGRDGRKIMDQKFVMSTMTIMIIIMSPMTCSVFSSVPYPFHDGEVSSISIEAPEHVLEYTDTSKLITVCFDEALLCWNR